MYDKHFRGIFLHSCYCVFFHLLLKLGDRECLLLDPLVLVVVHSYLNHCHTLLHKECLQRHGQKWDLEVTPKTCGGIDEGAQVILVWVRALGIESVSYP